MLIMKWLMIRIDQLIPAPGSKTGGRGRIVLASNRIKKVKMVDLSAAI